MKFGLLIVGEKGRYVLSELMKKGERPEFVVSYKDKNVLDEAYLEISDICKELNIRFYSTRDDIIYDLFDNVDKVFVIGWQFLLKKNLDKLVVIHDSYLPEYKGWSPTVNYLIEGSHYLAATAFEPTDVVDTGDIYYQIKYNIHYPMKISEAIIVVSEMYITLIEKILGGAKKKPMKGKESFCLWRDRKDYKINWNWTAKKIRRFVDAVGYPFDGAKIEISGYDYYLKVNSVEVGENIEIIDREPHIGKVFQIKDGNPIVICGVGTIKLIDVEYFDGSKYEFTKLKVRL